MDKSTGGRQHCRAMDVDEGENTAKAVLRPRNPGESIKVAETVLRRRDRNIKAAAERAAQLAKVKSKKQDYKKGKIRIIRAEKFVKNALLRQADRRRIRRLEIKKPNPKPTTGGKVVAVARNGRLGGSHEVKQALKAMGLAQRNTLVFLANTEETEKKLQLCRPFAYWGKPSFKVLFNLIHKKAMFKDPEAPTERVMLSDNVLIEKHLGDLGVLCTEDLAHVLHTRPPHFEQVVARLWPIQIGETRKSNGMVRDEKWIFGALGPTMNLKLQKLIGE